MVRGLAVAAAVGAALAGCHPTGLAVSDVAFTAAFAAALTFATARAHRWTWFLLAGVAAGAGHGWTLLPGFAALVVAFAGATATRRNPWAGGLVAALAVQSLLRIPSFAFHGSTALLAAAATLPALVSGYASSSVRTRARVRRVLFGLVGAAGLATAVFVAVALLAREQVDRGVTRSQGALRQVKAGESGQAGEELDSARRSFSSAEGLLSGFWAWPARAVPVVGQQATALARVTGYGTDLAGSSSGTVRQADYDRLKYRSGRFNLAAIRDLEEPIAEVSRALTRADRGVRAARSPWLVPPVADGVDRFAAELADATPDAAVAARAVRLAPDLLGGSGTRRYFLAFVTPVELRGSGGFVAGYGELTVADGEIRLSRSGPIRELGAPKGTRRLTGPADYLARFGRFRPADFFQDVTYSPDFPSDARVIEQLYPQSGGAPVDGVLTIDPTALAALLNFTGPVRVEGLDEPLTKKNAARILLRDQYLSLGGGQEDTIFTEAARKTFDDLTSGSLPGPQRVADVLSPVVRQGRLLMHSIRPEEQRLLQRIGMDGALPRPDGHDFLSVVSQNAGNSKIDMFLHRTISYAARVDPGSGRLNATVKVTLRNDAPAGGLPREVIGNNFGLPTGTNALLLSVYTPHRLVSASLNGLPVPVVAQRELGHAVYDRSIQIAPGGSVTLKLVLTGQVERGDYRLTVAPQPTVNADRLEARITPAEGWKVTRGGGFSPRAGAATATLTLVQDRRLTAGFDR